MLFGTALEGALIGAGVAVVVGLLYTLLARRKTCPRCGKPLPKGFLAPNVVYRGIDWLSPVPSQLLPSSLVNPTKPCPSCGCKLNAKLQPVEEGGEQT